MADEAYAKWKGEQRTFKREVEGPSGEKVVVESERTPSEFVMGVPARDLSKDEFDALTKDQQQLVRNCGLYEIAKPKSTSKE